VAHHEVQNFLRKHAPRGRVFLSDEVLAHVARVRLDQHDVLEARRRALRSCLDRLKQSRRELLERCYAGTESIKMIAENLGQSPNVLYMALKRLRGALFVCINRTLAVENLA